MAEALRVKLATPTSKLYEAEATSVVAPGALGQFTILPGHDPWMTQLGMGPLTVITVDGREQKFFVHTGFCQVDEDKVVILAEVGEAADKIDLERAAAAKKRAEERLQKAPSDPNIDFLRAEAALKRALYRLDIAGRK